MCECREFCLVLESIIFSLTPPVFITSPIRSHFIPDASSIVPLTLVFLSTLCGCTGPLSSLLHAWTATISCFSISQHFSRCRSPHWISRHKPIPWLATYFPQSPQTERANPFVTIFSGRPAGSRVTVSPRFIFFSFEAEKTTHRLCLPSFDPFECFLGPGPIFTPRGEDTKDLFHHSSTLDFPRHVFASVDFHISPPSLVLRIAFVLQQRRALFHVDSKHIPRS